MAKVIGERREKKLERKDQIYAALKAARIEADQETVDALYEIAEEVQQEVEDRNDNQ